MKSPGLPSEASGMRTPSASDELKLHETNLRVNIKIAHKQLY